MPSARRPARLPGHARWVRTRRRRWAVSHGGDLAKRPAGQRAGSRTPGCVYDATLGIVGYGRIGRAVALPARRLRPDRARDRPARPRLRHAGAAPQPVRARGRALHAGGPAHPPRLVRRGLAERPRDPADPPPHRRRRAGGHEADRHSGQHLAWRSRRRGRAAQGACGTGPSTPPAWTSSNASRRAPSCRHWSASPAWWPFRTSARPPRPRVPRWWTSRSTPSSTSSRLARRGHHCRAARHGPAHRRPATWAPGPARPPIPADPPQPGTSSRA